MEEKKIDVVLKNASLHQSVNKISSLNNSPHDENSVHKNLNLTNPKQSSKQVEKKHKTSTEVNVMNNQQSGAKKSLQNKKNNTKLTNQSPGHNITGTDEELGSQKSSKVKLQNTTTSSSAKNSSEKQFTNKDSKENKADFQTQISHNVTQKSNKNITINSTSSNTSQINNEPELIVETGVWYKNPKLNIGRKSGK